MEEEKETRKMRKDIETLKKLYKLLSDGQYIYVDVYDVPNDEERITIEFPFDRFGTDFFLFVLNSYSLFLSSKIDEKLEKIKREKNKN